MDATPSGRAAEPTTTPKLQGGSDSSSCSLKGLNPVKISNQSGNDDIYLVVRVEAVVHRRRRTACRRGTVVVGAAGKVVVVEGVVGAQKILALHFTLEAGNVAVAEVFAQLLHLLQLKQVNSKHLNGFYHLQIPVKFDIFI